MLKSRVPQALPWSGPVSSARESSGPWDSKKTEAHSGCLLLHHHFEVDLAADIKTLNIQECHDSAVLLLENGQGDAQVFSSRKTEASLLTEKKNLSKNRRMLRTFGSIHKMEYSSDIKNDILQEILDMES